MKENDNSARTIVIEQVEGGYILNGLSVTSKKQIVSTFSEAITKIAFAFGLLDFGHRIIFQDEKE
jgi:hypothetical protein